MKGIESDAHPEWGGTVDTGLAEDRAHLLAPPIAPSCVALTMPQIIRFVWSADPDAVVYYHHGRLYEDGLRNPTVRHKGRYVALCVAFGILRPRQRRGVHGDTHYYAVRTEESIANHPRQVLVGAITPDEFMALLALHNRQSSVSASRAIRDELALSDDTAVDLRNAMIRRGWVDNSGAAKLTGLGLSLLK